MTEKKFPKQEKPQKGFLPERDESDYAERSQAGHLPPKPRPQGPREDDLTEEGVPGWTPPKNDE